MRRLAATLLSLILLLSALPVALAASEEMTDAANALNELGLFKGTGTNADGTPAYDLDREPTRNEAVTMLIRLLGKEKEALAGEWDLPFTDVAEWAVPYVGYAYAHGLTNGTSDTTFGGTTLVSASQYLTFVLRALGYDSSTDFKWDAAWELSDEIGLTDGRYSEEQNGGAAFLRGDVALISNTALSCKLKGSNKTLLESMYDAGFSTLEMISDYPNGMVYWPKWQCLSIGFNQELDEHKLKAGSLVSGAGETVPLKASRGTTEKSVYLVSFNKELRLNEAYTLTIPANSIFGANGETFPEEILITFTTPKNVIQIVYSDYQGHFMEPVSLLDESGEVKYSDYVLRGNPAICFSDVDAGKYEVVINGAISLGTITVQENKINNYSLSADNSSPSFLETAFGNKPLHDSLLGLEPDSTYYKIDSHFDQYYFSYRFISDEINQIIMSVYPNASVNEWDDVATSGEFVGTRVEATKGVEGARACILVETFNEDRTFHCVGYTI